MATQLPGFLHALQPTLDRHGYLAVAGFIFLEDFGVPVPGETILIAAAIYAGAGRLNIVAVGVIAVAAAILGDNVGYAIGRFGGRPLVERFGRYVFLTPERIDKTTEFFERQGGKIVVVARFVEGLRQANGIVAGISEMPWLHFLAFNALGAVIWVALWTTVGDLAGNHITTIYNDVSRYFIIVVAVVAVLAIAIAIRKIRRRRQSRAAHQSPDDAHATAESDT